MAYYVALAVLLLVPFEISASPAGNRPHVAIGNIERANLYFSFGKNGHLITEEEEWTDTMESAAVPFRKCRQLLRGFIAKANNTLDRRPSHSNVSSQDALVHAERIIGKLTEVLRGLEYHETRPLTQGKFNWTMEKIVAKLDLILEQMERNQACTPSNKDEVFSNQPKEMPPMSTDPAAADIGLSTAITDDLRLLPMATTDDTQSSSTVMTEDIHSRATTQDIREVVKECKLDLVFVLDTSVSVGRSNFEIVKQFAVNISRLLPLGQRNTRIGIVTYSSRVSIGFHLKQYDTRAAVRRAIFRLHYDADLTNTAGALREMRTTMFTPENGDRSGVANVGILVTDGRSDHISSTIRQGNLAKQAGIRMYAVGIGSNVNEYELKAIASNPDSTYYHQVAGFPALRSIGQSLIKRSCLEAIRSSPIVMTEEIRSSAPVTYDDVSSEPFTAEDIEFLPSTTEYPLPRQVSTSDAGTDIGLSPAITGDIRSLPTATTEDPQSSSTAMTEDIHGSTMTQDIVTEAIRSSPIVMTEEIRSSAPITYEGFSSEPFTAGDIELQTSATEDPISRQVPTSACGRLFSAKRGRIVSPGWPIRYPIFVQCIIQIAVPRGLVPKLLFYSFSLEGGNNCPYDSLKIYDGPDNSAPKIGTYCGYVLPEPVVASGSEVYLEFRTDGSISRRGFAIDYIAFHPASRATVKDFWYSSSIRGDAQLSPSVTNEDDYHRRSTSTVIIEDIQTSSPVLTEEMQSLSPVQTEEMQSSSPVLTEETQSSSPVLTGETQSSSPVLTEEMQSSSPVLTEETQSSSRFLSEETQSWSPVMNDNIKRSSHILTDTYVLDDGIRSSPISTTDDALLLPLTMPQGVRLESAASKTLRGEIGTVKAIRSSPVATTEEIRSSTRVTRDDVGSPKEFTFGDIPATMDPITRDVSTARIPNSAVCSDVYCGTYSGHNGTILSPGWPGYYRNHVLCNIRISAPAGHVVSLFFHSFLLESHDDCSYDYLKIHDGSGMRASLLGTFCGVTRPGPVLSSGSEVYMQFKTDTSMTNRGFDIEYTASTGGCNKTFKSHFGRILSPRWPDEYPNNLMCNIRVTAGNRITLSFNYFNLESHNSCGFDYLKIFDGASSSAPLLVTLCGDKRPATLQSTGKSLFMVFKTDGGATRRGFDIVYVSGNT